MELLIKKLKRTLQKQRIQNSYIYKKEKNRVFITLLFLKNYENK